jgi:hypothetical protein
MRFSIRDLLLVTVIVALTLGWWIERQKRTYSEQKREYWEQRALQEGRNIRMLLKHVEHGGMHNFEYDHYLHIKEENAAATKELYTEPEAILPSLPNSHAPVPNLPKP